MKRKILIMISVFALQLVHSQTISLVADLENESPGWNAKFVVFNGKTYFNSNNTTSSEGKIYSIDSSNNVQEELILSTSIYDLTTHGNFLYFITSNGSDNVGRIHRMASNGTVQIVSSTYGAYDLMSFNGELYFAGEANKVEDGTVIFGDLYSFNETSSVFRLVDTSFDYGMSIASMTLHQGELYFIGEIAALTFENALYKTDGVSISQVLSYNSETLGTNRPKHLTSYNQSLFFSGIVGSSPNFDYRLFEVNTTTNVFSNITNYFAKRPFVFEGDLYFVGRNDQITNSSYELLKKDGNSSVVSSIPLTTTNGQINGLSYASFSSLENTLIVSTSAANVGYEIFTIDNGSLSLTQDSNPGTYSFIDPNAPFNSQMHNVGGKLYVTGEHTNAGSSQHFTNIYELTPALCVETVGIENANFEAYLENELGVGDGILGNKKVCKQKIEILTELNLSGAPGYDENAPGLGITNLSGIEFFRDLQTLYVHANDLTSIDLSNNKELIDIRAFNNSTLQSINIDGLSKLEIIGLNNNQITSIDVSSNTSLATFHIANNNLSTLNISKLSALTNFNAEDNTNLICIQVANETTATSYNNDTSNYRRNGATVFDENCNPKVVDVFVSSGQTQDANDFWLVTSANNPIVVSFNVEDANGTELTATEIPNYSVVFNSAPSTAFNPAQGGNINNSGIDFEGITNEQISVTTVTNGADATRTVAMRGDGIFEADEYFNIEISTNDTNISLKNSDNGIIHIPVRIIDNEKTNINLELVQNGIENSQNARLRITTSLQNDTGAPMPFTITLNGGDAIISEDYQAITNPVAIPNGASSVEFDVIILNNDTVAETLETFNASISYAGNLNDVTERVTIVDGSKAVSITDDGNTTAFVVSTSITNAGTAPEYEIEEGQSFQLNFDTGTTGINGTTYKPVITITKNGTEPNEDFTVNLDQTFTIGTANPDGSIVFTANDDGMQEGDETYVISIASEDTSKYTLNTPDSFTVIVKDKKNTNAKQISVKLFADNISEENTLTFPYNVREGPNNKIHIGFDAINFNASELANYSVSISTTDNTAFASNDYSTVNNSYSITTKDSEFDFYNSYESAISIKNDAVLNENDESFFIDITPVDNTISIVDYSINEQGTVLDPGETLTMEVFIKNSDIYYGDELIIFDTEMKGNFELIDDIYYVNEGETLQLEFDAQTPNIANEYAFDIEFSSYGTADLNQDYELSFDTSIPLNVDNESSPDGMLEITIKPDSYNDQQETITLKLIDGQYGLSTYSYENYNENSENNSKYIQIVINNVNANNAILAELDNTGGTEGNGEENGIGTDTFTLNLKNDDGTIYIAQQQLVFPINFSPDPNSTDYEKAEENDYIIPSPSEIIIPAGASSGSIIIELPQEEEENDEHEFYLATVSLPTGLNNISLPDPLQAKIIDDEGKFNVLFTMDNSNINIADGPGAGCCVYNIVEEGESIRYSFKAEKGALLNTEYKIAIKYEKYGDPLEDPAEEGEDKDFYNTAIHEDLVDNNGEKIEVITSKVNSQNSDYNLSIKINSDDDDKEQISIRLSAYSNNINLLESRFYDPDFLIIPTIRASLLVTDSTADEENSQNDKGLFIIKLEEPATTQMAISYLVDGTAVNGDDFKTIQSTIMFATGEMEKEIEIEALPDDIPEDEKTIILTLLDGQGYSINSNNDRGTVKIPKNDQDKIVFDISLKALNTQIYEDPSKQNEGSFQIKIEPANTSGIDLTINYAFIDGTATYPAIEGEENDFKQNSSGILIFKSGEANSQLITVTAQEDPDIGIEETETITLSLIEGNRYSAAQTSNATMEIVSTEYDKNKLSVEDLQVTVATNTCANANEGNVTIKNKSQSTFIATISPENISITLAGNTVETVKDLSSGKHTITFSFEDETIDLIPPSFEILIEELGGTNLTGKKVNLTSKTASLKVSGSRKYSVFNGSQEYAFAFNEYSEKTITIPLKNGVNNIIIKGESACQGVIETKMYLNQFVVFPNPTNKFITFSGFLLEEEARIIISDLSGKRFINSFHEILGNSVKVDLSELPTGLYFGSITTESGQDVQFKILKD